MYKATFNDSGIDKLASCKPWWRNFVKHCKKDIGTLQWINISSNYLDTALRKEGVVRGMDPDWKYDEKDRILIFESEAHFHWFVIKWSE